MSISDAARATLSRVPDELELDGIQPRLPAMQPAVGNACGRVVASLEIAAVDRTVERSRAVR